MNALEVLRLLVGVPLVLGLPGYAWSLVLLPGARGLLERATWSVLLSLALVPLGAIAWSAALGLPLGPVGALALILLLAGLGFGAARWRQRSALNAS